MDPLSQQVACDQRVITNPQVHSDLVAAKGVESDDRQFIVSTTGGDVVTLAHSQNRRLGQSVDRCACRAGNLHTVAADSLDRKFVGGVISANH